MLEFETMEEQRLMTSYSEHQKVLALALATVFVGSGRDTQHGNVLVTDKCPFNKAFMLYANALQDPNASPLDIVEQAKITFLHGKKKFGRAHRHSFMLENNLAHAYLQSGDFRAASAHYLSVLSYHEEVMGDESQDYFFTLLDIIHLIKAFKLNANKQNSNTPPVFSSLPSLLNKLLSVTDALVISTPESALLYREQALKAAHSHPGLMPLTRIRDLALDYARDTIRTYGKLSEAAIEARFFLGKIYFDMKAIRKALIEFVAVLDALDEILAFSHPYALASHARLVSLYERQGKSNLATRHCQAVGKLRVWDNSTNQQALHANLPNYAKVLGGTYNKSSTCDGLICLSFDISSLGYTENISVISSTKPALNELVINAFSTWRFAPKYENGAPVVARQQQIQINIPN
ncbi:energy transducer TonB [Glaciecola sp. MH2013]|uniref:energy transducer TonB n=1 Tax=Glaciecola sp. MH2013 TaxID=2785524 RepID=UPI0018A0E8A6|nr:energy transducer TonB [Glaciecola sp. MH2013]MBF7074465.1 energy transducer TonB [Glaciecola sp. MH2013]